MNKWTRRQVIALGSGITVIATLLSCRKTPETKEESYKKLEELLAAGKWQEADLKTLDLMLKITDREKEGFVYADQARIFPCTELQTINNLWLKYSNGRFGLSVQAKLWESLGFKPGAYSYENFYQLAERVGWRRNGQWIEYKNLNFSSDAPEGHLPVRIIAEEWDVRLRKPSRRLVASIEVLWTDLTARITNCKTQ